MHGAGVLPPQAVRAPDDMNSDYSYYSGSEHQSPRSEASYSSNSSSYTSNTERSAISTADEPPLHEPQEERVGFLDWCRARAQDVSSAVAQIGHLEIGPPVIYTPRDAPQPQVSHPACAPTVALSLCARRSPPLTFGGVWRARLCKARPRASRAGGGVASIPWKELVGLKESLLTHMEGAAAAEEKLNEHASSGGGEAGLRRRLAELDAGIIELNKVLEAEEKETEAIAASLRRQVQQYEAELAAMDGEKQKLEQKAAERQQRERERGERGLMGEVARRQEAKLEEAKRWSAEARIRAQVHQQVIQKEVEEAETAAAAVTKPMAVGHIGPIDTGAVPASLRGMLSPSAAASPADTTKG
jgi:hypothetical protein